MVVDLKRVFKDTKGQKAGTLTSQYLPYTFMCICQKKCVRMWSIWAST